MKNRALKSKNDIKRTSLLIISPIMKLLCKCTNTSIPGEANCQDMKLKSFREARVHGLVVAKLTSASVNNREPTLVKTRHLLQQRRGWSTHLSIRKPSICRLIRLPVCSGMNREKWRELGSPHPKRPVNQLSHREQW